MNVIQKEIELCNGEKIILETGKLAKQADGAVVLRQGKTMLLATVVSAKEAKEDVDFMPLQVEYKEKYAASGRFPGGFLKRETRPGDYEILVSRLVDRALRPLFPDDYHAETFVTINLISADKNIKPDALAGLAASAALAVSDVPFGGPISEVRVARIDGKMMINPTFEEVEKADLDIIVAATFDNIMMVEGEMKEVSEDDLLEALKFAHEEIRKHCRAQMELCEMVGKTVKRTYCHEVNDDELRAAIRTATYDKTYEVAKSQKPKHERSDAFEAIANEFLETIPEEQR
ncbi:MAG: polyribonucleotide nucleotidyltransferase, partial [Bacteroidales bacterium]|nr:polyribonucleotide nucleotidyltransferase [Bacteroidales bacterium]